MLMLVNPCQTSSVLKVIYFILQLLKIAAIIFPVGLLLMLTIDFAKSVISNEQDMDKHKKIAIRRAIICACIFFVPSIVSLAFNVLHNSGIVVNYTSCIANANLDAISRFEEQEELLKETIENTVVAPTDPQKSGRVIVSEKSSKGEKSIKDAKASKKSSKKDTNTKDLIEALDRMSEVVQRANKSGKNWTYSNSGTKGSFAKAWEDNKKTNCAKYISWGLIEVGILNEGQYFYKCYGGKNCSGNNIIYSSDNAKEKMEKNLEYIKGEGQTASKLIKNKVLKKGDIVLWQNQVHTNAYAGDKKWYDAGRWSANGAKGDLKFKTFGPVTISSLNNWRVWKILRIKE